MKKFSFTLLVAYLSLSLFIPPGIVEASVSPQIADFLCEQGLTYYNQNNGALALIEFKKALLADPKSVVALEYIAKIENQKVVIERRPASGQKAKRSVVESRPYPVKKLSPQEKKEIADIQKAVLFEKKIEKNPPRPILQKIKQGLSGSGAVTSQEITQFEQAEEVVVDLKDMQKKGDFYEVETAVDDTLLLRSAKIDKFVVADPASLSVTRQSDEEILIQPKTYGTAYMYLWDDQGRRNIKFDVGPRRISEYYARLIETQGREAELPEPFIANYSIENDSFYTGRRLYNVERTSYPYTYTAELKGETPYGRFDAATQASRNENGQYYIPNVRLSLTDAHYDQFRGINIYGFDFTPDYYAFGFPTSDLRGVSVDASVAHHRFSYTTFWGSMPEGLFTPLASTSGLSQQKKAWLEGVGLNYNPLDGLNLKSYFAHSYGPELEQPVLTNNVLGAGFDYSKGMFSLGSEMTSDMTHESYTARMGLNAAKWDLGLTMTDNNRNYASVFGGEPAAGDIGETLNFNFRPTSTLTFANAFSADRDLVFFNPSDPMRPNYTGSSRVEWYADSLTEYEAGYYLDDRRGSNTPSVTETKDMTIRRQFFAFRRIGGFLSYQNSKAKYYTSPAQDFNNNRIIGGVSFRVFGELYFYCNKEFDMLHNNFSGENAYPTAEDMGFNYFRQIGSFPLYWRSRITYHMEHNTESNLSYMSGEDRLEGENELTYKPTPDNEFFLRLRLDNIWEAKEGVAKHFDLDLAWGARLMWDTGFRWMPQGSFDGYVFFDANGDGKREAGENGVGGVLIKASQGQNAKTDAKGYYRIKNISGKLTTLTLDPKSLPKGYGATTSVTRDVDVVQSKTKRVDFGVATHMEISGIVFVDKNGNGKYDPGTDEALKGVALIFDGKEKAISSVLGEYMFRQMAAGEHTVSLDLKTIPVKYIPKVPVKKTLKVTDGESVNYNIPVELQTVK